MKIGIIGAGNIGGTLGRRWAEAGHSITFGVRNPSEAKFAALGEFGAVGTVSQAVEHGEAILLAIPGSAVTGFSEGFGDALKGKVVIDTTNNVGNPVMNSLTVLGTHAPGAYLARAFSTLGWENFSNPQIGGVQIDLFYCAQPAARAITEMLISNTGLRPVYVGDIDSGFVLDGLTRLWFSLVFGQNLGRRLAFKLLVED